MPDLSSLVEAAALLRAWPDTRHPDPVLGHHVEVHGGQGEIVAWIVAPQGGAAQAHAALAGTLPAITVGRGLRVALNLSEQGGDGFTEWEILNSPETVLRGQAFHRQGEYAGPADAARCAFLQDLVGLPAGR